MTKYPQPGIIDSLALPFEPLDLHSTGQCTPSHHVAFQTPDIPRIPQGCERIRFLEDCCADCASNPDCAAYTWTAQSCKYSCPSTCTGFPNSLGRCWLKTRAPSNASDRLHAPSIVSGVLGARTGTSWCSARQARSSKWQMCMAHTVCLVIVWMRDGYCGALF
jgi:hypothetical protein